MTSPPYWSLRDYEVAGQIGQEHSLDIYLAKMLHITLALYKILKPTGIMYWNHGDCYGGSNQSWCHPKGRARYRGQNSERPPTYNFMSKCLVMQNYRLIMRMIDEQGWIFRNQIIWHKLNHMPSSVTDRLTNTYEPVFVMVKSQKYFYDLDAIRQPHIKAGCPEFVCNKCGKPRERITEPSPEYKKRRGKSWHDHRKDKARGQRMGSDRPACSEFITVGWTECGCGAGFSPGVVLDPFCGSGRTGIVARMLGRKFIGLDIKFEYCLDSKLAISKVGHQMKFPLP